MANVIEKLKVKLLDPVYLFVTMFLVLCLSLSAQESRTWEWHSDGAFKYPGSFSHTKLFVDDVPGMVEVFSKENIQLCFWPLLGYWSTEAVFPEKGVWLSPKERVGSVTYRAKSQDIVSGYTQDGNIYYLKQKILFGGEVKHSSVLVLIYPPSEQNNVSELINVVKDW